MQALVVYAHDPFHPTRHREVKRITRRRRIDKLAPQDKSRPCICVLNGKYLLRHNKGWQRSVGDGDVLTFIMLPQGGGGGGSNPLKVILSLAITIAAPYMAMEMMPALGLTTEFQMSILTAAIGFVGKMLVNVLIPDPKPSQASIAQGTLAAASPTYNLNAQGNQARIGAAIPVIYGRHMTYPDFGAQPFTEYAGNEQYLYQMFVIGQGQYSIEQIRLEDSIIEGTVVQDGAIHNATGSFEEIQYQVCYGSNVTLYPSNVTTSTEVTGAESDCQAATYSQASTTLTVTLNAHGYLVNQWVYLNITSGTAVSGFYQVVTVATNTFTVTAATATTSGNVSVGHTLGGFIANASGTSSNAIGIDVVLPKGLYYANNAGGLDSRSITFTTHARPVDSAGAPTGAWVALGTETISAATTTPQRQTYRYSVALGRYEVRISRTSAKDNASQAGNDLNWAAMRSYLPGTQNYGNVTVLAMKMRASNQLSIQSSRRINCVLTRKLQMWNGTAWTTETATRNPAWAIADIIKASYGMALTDIRLDPNGLKALATIWDSRGDTFDGIFDSQQPAWQALTQTARVGRAMPYQQAGAVYITRDQAATTPVALFSMRNIIKQSMKLTYMLPAEETADAVDVDYFDSGTWQTRTVRAYLPGSTQSKVAKRQLFGCTSRDQAWREGMYMAAANRYRRRMISLSTEMEGFIPTVGDLIAIQHDMPQWGQSGELTAWDSVGLIATLSEPATFTTGTHYIGLRKRDGSVDGPYAVTAGVDANHVVFAAAPAIVPDVGSTRERTHFAFGPGSALYLKARVISVKPRSLERAEINAVVESDYVHTADTGAAPTDTAWQLRSRITAPVVAGLMARSDPNTAEKMFLSWQPAAGATGYLIEVSDSGAGWTRVGETSTANYTAVATFGARTMVRVCAVGLVRGPWVEISYGASASYMWSGTDTNLMWTADPNLMWRY